MHLKLPIHYCTCHLHTIGDFLSQLNKNRSILRKPTCTQGEHAPRHRKGLNLTVRWQHQPLNHCPQCRIFFKKWACNIEKTTKYKLCFKYRMQQSAMRKASQGKCWSMIKHDWRLFRKALPLLLGAACVPLVLIWKSRDYIHFQPNTESWCERLLLLYSTWAGLSALASTEYCCNTCSCGINDYIDRCCFMKITIWQYRQAAGELSKCDSSQK